VFEGFLEGIPVDVKFAADGAFAPPIDEDATADLGPGLHVGVHRRRLDEVLAFLEKDSR